MHSNPNRNDIKPASPFIPKDQSPGPGQGTGSVSQTPVRVLPEGQRVSRVWVGGSNVHHKVIQPDESWLRTEDPYPGRYMLPNDEEDRVRLGRDRDVFMRRKISVPSCQALRHAVSTLYRIDDFQHEKIGAGFFSEVFKVTHKTTKKVMVLKMNKQRSNRTNMLKEVQLMNKLNHPNILRFEAACVHEGQLHALTEYMNGGSLEQLIQRKDEDLPWSVRLSLALDIAKGLAYLHSKGMFHRDLTSKNILIKHHVTGSKTAVIGDFGLATKIPSSSDFRLPQVGSPYWMSPECLRGKFYDHRADIFSYGIVMCELIGRMDADPDVLPRTENFGVDYIAFSEKCPSCPPDFLKLAYTCVRIDPSSRPSTSDLVVQLGTLLDSQRRQDNRSIIHVEGRIQLRKVGHKRCFSEAGESDPVRWSPSEKARFHFRPHLSVISVGKEMSLRDPHYRPSPPTNPFATLPRLREGRKIMGSSRDLFSSCFELPSPARVATPTGSRSGDSPTKTSSPTGRGGVQSLPSSPTLSRCNSLDDLSVWNRFADGRASPGIDNSKLADHLFQGRVQLLKRLYSGGGWVTQDDSAVELSSASSSSSSSSFPLRRRGSCESGFHSVGADADWLLDSGLSSARSIGSSLLTVSDLEEDLRMASAFLCNKRTSSVFTDSTDDLSIEVEEAVTRRNPAIGSGSSYEKDIRDIVEYFEQTCRVMGRRSTRDHRSIESIQLQRSQKIDSLIKRVVEKESRDRLRKSIPTQRLQICEGIVRSKLPLFDHTKKPPRARLPYDQKGFVKAKLAIFDPPKPKKAGKAAGTKSISTVNAHSAE